MIKWIFYILALSFVPVALYFMYFHGIWRFNYPSEKEYPIQGLDISHHQGEIDWNLIPKERYQFVYIKATEGGDFKDKKFKRNWEQARKAGFKVGAYHFFTLCKGGDEQAKNFIATVPALDDSLAPVIDLEFVGNCLDRPDKEVFLNELEKYVLAIDGQYAAHPVLYTTYDFFEYYLVNSRFANFPLWVRDITGTPNSQIFSDWDIWQYADNARVPGIRGPVDLNVARGPLPKTPRQ